MDDGIIYWNLDPEIFSIFGTFPIRYYSLLFITGLLVALQVEKRIYRKENIQLENLDKLFIYVIVGIVLGARLGHCFFYEPSYYLDNPLEVLLPIRKVADSYQFTGFQGLASHGGTIGVILAIVIYCRKYKTKFLWVLDRIAIVGPIVGAFIRFGNFMNSEVYGKPTNGNWGVVFQRDDLIPRHPTQLYEAFSYLLIFGILMFIYHKTKGKMNGLILGVLLTLVFSARIVIEFFKENQVGFEDGMALNMGQILSIPLVIIGLILIFTRKIPSHNKTSLQKP
ncbi:prolipoprotein diacylglyceryl transferase [Maribacter dokdonensis]|uniref:prolipoprotein diacylglyceryl transferase n=1 Tax=Maribacter dokdonensis TaxID=320912 RepID=UPI001B1B628E|nr:prolipoprotein diacylglyceryl transferase [Maribacter dokdonensis]CAG2533944.1 prolipoprotein diacylglyceryl transferase [Maribacter dokdonensis]